MPNPPDTTDRFEIKRQLGRGGNGVVYHAYDRERGMDVALKTLRHLDPTAQYRFKREFRELADVTHPNLVTLFELLSDGGTLCLTMELVRGRDLLTYVRGGQLAASSATQPARGAQGEEEDEDDDPTMPTGVGRPPAERADPHRLRDAFGQLAEALCALHDSGHLHHDIKPSNVLVADSGRVVLLDFGVVTATEALPWHDRSADLGGTPTFMAPERGVPGAAPDEASDWYSVGVMLYMALSGRRPFAGDAISVMHAKRTRPPPPLVDAPADLEALCMDLLSIDPAERPPGREVIERLRGAPRRVPAAAVAADAEAFPGRARHLAVLRDQFAEARAGVGNTVYVHGASGMGKSSLVARFLEEVARDPEAIVLAGRCYRRESVPYKAIDSVVDALGRVLLGLSQHEAEIVVPRNAATLARVFPVLRRVPAIEEAPQRSGAGADPHDLQRRAFAALRTLMGRLAERRPVVVFIDDLQWGDVDSAALLGALMNPPDAPPMMLIGCYRTEERERSPLLKALLRRESRWGTAARAQHIEVGPLSPDEARSLARALFGGAVVDASAVDTVVDEAGGNPYFIHELVRFARSRGAGGASGAPSLDDVLRARVAALRDPGRRLLEVVAVAGQPTALDTAHRAASLTGEDALAAVQQLLTAHLARVSRDGDRELITVYHDRVQEVVTADLSAAARKQHHRDLALALRDAGRADAETLAAHFSAAGQAALAAEYAADAADQASRALAFDRAAALYRSALQLAENEDVGSLQLRLADALVVAGRGREAADVLLAAAERAAPATRRECRTRAAEQLLVSGHIERGLQTIGALLADAGISYPATQRRALLSVLWHRARLRVRGLRWTEADESELTAADRARLHVLEATRDGLAMVDNIRGADFHARAMLLALRMGDSARIFHCLSREAVFAGSRGGRGLARAAELVDQMRAIARSRRDPAMNAWVVTSDGFVRYFSGRLAAAARQFAAAEDELREYPTSPIARNNARLLRLFALRRIGSFEQCRQLLDEYVRDADRRGDRYADTSMRRACNFLYLVRDRPDDARRDLEETSWIAPTRGFHLQHWYELEARGDIALYEGTVAEQFADLEPSFTAVSKSLLLRLQIIRAQAFSLWGRLWVARAADPSLRRRGLKEAERSARRLLRERIGYATVWGLMLRAGIAERRGDTSAAVAAFERAEEAARACDLSFHAWSAQWRRGRLLGGDEGAKLVAASHAALERAGVVDLERATRTAVGT